MSDVKAHGLSEKWLTVDLYKMINKLDLHAYLSWLNNLETEATENYVLIVIVGSYWW